MNLSAPGSATLAGPEAEVQTQTENPATRLDPV